MVAHPGTTDAWPRRYLPVVKESRPLNYSSPFMTWEQLPKETRAEVVRLAEAGRFHPDRDLRRLAYGWAAPIACEPGWSLWLSAALNLLTAIGGPADGIAEFRDRRYAKSIVALGDPSADLQR